MVFAKSEHIQPDLIGQLDFLDKIFETACTFRTLAIGCFGIDIRECVKAEFHNRCSCF
ncbi:hypothetical protein D3C80_1119790 [compost metagenome]